MDNIKDLKDAVEKYGNMPTENAFEYKTEAGLPERLTEDQWLERLMNELPEHGIDTSQWEYKYGDGCYTAAEFLARCIKGYNSKND